MSDVLRRIDGQSDGLGVDMELADVLHNLDPAVDDPTYWTRFRGWVVSSAHLELARRRLVADLTVGDVVSSWARTLVPTAALAAALAGMLMVRSGASPAPGPLALEEQLVAEIPGETVPLLLALEGTEGIVTFASEDF